ncbi:cold shock domain-containing protein [Vibrio breoganii]|uniref:cold shock domain-containing protein n=1 Tax=Vibrio breoganii TaxID=553239 RepID=UPI000C82DC84|nr:cold shock domain-containing protein [Vibrio breoganii]PMH15928.1 hypothetical protein BCU74_13255 [Vibrio breoganii]PMM15357.1 hypothetical protein BCT60_07410 [Vibrio breoganii]TKG19937.1 cold shock domain-containing protein [Vibrio breoganii]
MHTGNVVSFSVEKGFGFIGSQKESYFFHASQLPKDIAPTEVMKGMAFQFDAIPGPKGMRAKKLVYIKQTTVLQKSSAFVVSKAAQPKHGKAVVRVPVSSCYYSDPQCCRDELINAAKATGCNGVLNLEVKRVTWSEGNYKYTMHTAHAELCVIAEPKPCKPSEEAAYQQSLSQSATEAEKVAKQLAAELESQRNRQTFPWGMVFIGIALLIACLVIY